MRVKKTINIKMYNIIHKVMMIVVVIAVVLVRAVMTEMRIVTRLY